MTVVPESHTDLLERPTFAHLATVRPDGAPQVNPMWFAWDGERVRFTHTRRRQKFRNLEHSPAIAMSIIDPQDDYRYLELRGTLESVEADPTGAFYVELARRYGMSNPQPPPDIVDRVILVVRPTHAVAK